MCKQILLNIILATTIIITSQSSIHAQSHFGVEAGATVSSVYTTTQTLTPYDSSIKPIIGARAGLFFEHEIKDFFAIKTGVFGALKGSQLQTGDRWNLIYLTVPILAVFTPIKPLKIGVGVELGALVADNFPLLTNNKLSLGIRGEITWQISPAFRLIAHSTVDVTPIYSIYHTDDQGFLLTKNNYNNITGGLSLAYTIKSFGKKG